jgi:hypothetical protein
MIFFETEQDFKNQLKHDIEWTIQQIKKWRRIYKERYGHEYRKRPAKKPKPTVH